MAGLAGPQTDHPRVFLTGKRPSVLAKGFPSRIDRGASHHLFTAQSKDSLRARIAVDDGPFRRLDHHAVRHRGQDGTQALFDSEPDEGGFQLQRQDADEFDVFRIGRFVPP